MQLQARHEGTSRFRAGADEKLKWVESKLKARYDIKTKHFGLGKNQAQEVRVLNRTLRWTSKGLEYKADPRQGEKFPRDPKLDGEGVKSVGSPGIKPTRDLDGDVPFSYSLPSGRGVAELPCVG